MTQPSQQTAADRPCQNCRTSDARCLATARQTGVVCCTQCREWPMHGGVE